MDWWKGPCQEIEFPDSSGHSYRRNPCMLLTGKLYILLML